MVEPVTRSDRPSFPSDLRVREEAMIEARRKIVSLEPRSGVGLSQWLGVALSGGGVRSATFNLGVLQALAKAGVLRDIDYLSTVSGGGYVGGFLGRLYSRFLNRPRGAASVVEYKLSNSQSQEITWLRHSGEYLSPAGRGDTLVNAAVAVRNFLTVHLILGVLLLALLGSANGIRYVAIPYLFAWADADPIGYLSTIPFAWLLPYASVWVVVFTLLGLGWLLPLAIAYWLPSQTEAEAFQGSTTLAALVVTGAAILYGLETGSLLVAITAWIICTAAFIYVEAAWRSVRLRMPGALLNPNTRAMTRNVLSTRLGPALAVTGAFFVISVIDAAARWIYDAAGRRMEVASMLMGMGWMLLALYLPLRVIARWISAAIPAGDDRGCRNWFCLLAHPLVLPVIVGVPPLIVVAVVSHAAYGAGLDSRAGLVATAVSIVVSLILGRSGGIALVNRSSLQSMYAARGTRAYLGASNVHRHATEEGADVTTTQPDDDVSWHRYRPDLAGGPLHLVNVFVNESIDRASQRGLRDRQGENMAVGPCGVSVGIDSHALWVESARFGETRGRLRPNEALELPHPFMRRVDLHGSEGDVLHTEELSLGDWLAVSGAALSPGRGSETRLGASLILGIANLRVGHWWDSAIEDGQREGEAIPSIRQAVSRLATRALRTQWLLLSEFTGRFAGPWRRFWFLSDGGNFENLGVYELLRRRVPLIICSDASRDVRGGLEGLANLVRKARIDFCAEIQFLSKEEIAAFPVERRDSSGAVLVKGLPQTVADSLGPLEDLRFEPGGKSAKHAAIARVFFESTDRPEAVLLYIKSSVTGDEAPDVIEYGSRNRDFPHESTVDQFFDESQWESYRKLGEHCATPFFGSAGLGWMSMILDPAVANVAPPST